jgi:predicted MFS family arabinose efflux permease
VLNVIAGVGGISPVISPLRGAGILQAAHWRTAFWVLAAAGIVMALCVVFVVPESRLAGRVSTRKVIVVGLISGLVAGVVMLVGTLLAFIGLVIARTPSNPAAAHAQALSGISSGPS